MRPHNSHSWGSSQALGSPSIAEGADGFFNVLGDEGQPCTQMETHSVYERGNQTNAKTDYSSGPKS